MVIHRETKTLNGDLDRYSALEHSRQMFKNPVKSIFS